LLGKVLMLLRLHFQVSQRTKDPTAAELAAAVQVESMMEDGR
jgi:hypothetical protein